MTTKLFELHVFLDDRLLCRSDAKYDPSVKSHLDNAAMMAKGHGAYAPEKVVRAVLVSGTAQIAVSLD